MPLEMNILLWELNLLFSVVLFKIDFMSTMMQALVSYVTQSTEPAQQIFSRFKCASGSSLTIQQKRTLYKKIR